MEKLNPLVDIFPALRDKPCQLVKTVIDEIWSYFGKEDLLNSRLVNQTWNNVCLTQLRDRESRSRYLGFYQTLTANKLPEYIDFANSTSKPSNFVLPFHLQLKCKLVLGNQGFEPLNAHVDSLITLFGSECVKRLSLTTDLQSCTADEFSDLGIIQLLTKIAPGLETLDLTGLKIQMNEENVRPNFGDLIFPKLKTILDKPNRTNTTKIQSQCPIYSGIIERCPNLEDLGVNLDWDLSVWPLPLNRLKTMAIGRFLNPAGWVEKFQEIPTLVPVLKTLTFNLPTGREREIELVDILDYFSGTLKSLTIFKSMAMSNEYSTDTSRLTLIPFRRFPQLKSLHLPGRTYWYGVVLDPLEYNFNPHTFPELETIEISIGVLVTIPVPRVFPNNECTTLPNVRKLILQLNNDRTDPFFSLKRASELNSCMLFKEVLEHLQTVFPNVSIISLMDKTRARNGFQMKHFLKALIQSSRAHLLQEIQIQDCGEDCLGQVLTQMEQRPRIVIENLEGNPGLEQTIKTAYKILTGGVDAQIIECEEDGKQVLIVQEEGQPTDHNMKNIRRVRLELSNEWESSYLRADDFETTTFTSNTPREFYFTTMAKHFPRLEEIQVSSIMFRCEQETRQRRIQKTIDDFPNLRINII